jgi:serine/threonine protein kinase
MIHQISKGMAYLHREGVLHGDLKVQVPRPWLILPKLMYIQAANVLVDDDTRCVISDFGQSEMKSEVYRISHAPLPRRFRS